MRLLQLLVALLFIVAGIVVGALNPQSMTLDFYFARLHLGVGVALLSALLAGALLGGLAITIGVVWPLQRRLQRAWRERSVSAANSGIEPPSPLP